MAELVRASYLIGILYPCSRSRVQPWSSETLFFLEMPRQEHKFIHNLFASQFNLDFQINREVRGIHHWMVSIDGFTIYAESFVSTIVGGHPVKRRLEDKIAQLHGASLTLVN